VLPERGDRLEDYDHVPAQLTGSLLEAYGGIDRQALKRTSDGKCIYLGPEGCTIYDRRPHQCKIFDCRLWVGQMSHKQRLVLKRSSNLNKHILQAALQRMHTI
jgi:Fe-S-cluster containining protein